MNVVPLRRLAGFGLGLTVALAVAPHAIRGQVRPEPPPLTLLQAIDSAVATHPSLGAAEARIDAAAATHDVARAAYLPSLAGAAALMRYEEPMVVAPLHGFDPMHPPAFDRTLLQSQMSLDYTLFDGGARGALSRGARSAEEATVLRRDATSQDLLRAVTSTYTAVLAAREVRTAAALQVEALASEMDRAEQRLREGTAARVEVLRAEAALLDARAQSATAEANAGLAERNLARLIGADPASMAGRALEGITPASAGSPGRDGANPILGAAERNVQAARARLQQERAGRLPSLRATASLLDFGSGEGEHVAEWQAGVRVSWPLFTGGARQAAIRRAEADLRAAEDERAQVELAVAGDLDAADAAWLEAEARSRALAASVAQWEEVARVEALSMASGAGVQQDYLRAQAALFAARAGHARARYDVVLALVGRARAQGNLDRDWMITALETAR